MLILCLPAKLVYSQDNLRTPTLKYKTLKYTTKNTSLPDLFFDSLKITKAPSLEDPTVQYSFTIGNKGVVSAHDVKVKIIIDDIIREEHIIAKINPGEKIGPVLGEIEDLGTLKQGYHITGIIDPEHKIKEADRNNNDKGLLFSSWLPDVNLETIEMPTICTSGVPLEYILTIKNLGKYAAKNIKIKVGLVSVATRGWDDREHATQELPPPLISETIGEHFIGVLNAGKETKISNDFYLSLPPGQYFVIAHISSEDKLQGRKGVRAKRIIFEVK